MNADVERARDKIVHCAEECVACLGIARRCALLDDPEGASEFRVYAAEWSKEAFRLAPQAVRS